MRRWGTRSRSPPEGLGWAPPEVGWARLLGHSPMGQPGRALAGGAIVMGSRVCPGTPAFNGARGTVCRGGGVAAACLESGGPAWKEGPWVWSVRLRHFNVKKSEAHSC